MNINKLRKNESQLLLVLYIIFNIVYLLMGIVVVNFYKDMFFEKFQIFSYGLIALLAINIPAIIALIIKKKYIKNTIDLFLIGIVIFSIISLIFAFNFKYALLGFYIRNEGFFQIMYYITILFLASFIDNEYKEIIIHCILLTGIVELVYAITQVYGPHLDLPVYKRNELAKGFVHNSNFFGTYMLLCLLYSVGLFYKEKKKKKKVLYIILTTLFLIGLFISNTLSCVVGYIGVMFLLLIYSFKNKQIKKYILVCLLTLITVIPLTMLNKTNVLSDLLKTSGEVKEISKGNLDDSYGTNRLYIWKNTVKIIPKYLIHGVGIDNFFYAFNGKELRFKNVGVYDKAHNEYLQILITEGIFSLLCYLGLYILLIINGIKTKNYYILLPVIGYLIQAFFNISVIDVAPFFYISCGLLINRNSYENKKQLI